MIKGKKWSMTFKTKEADFKILEKNIKSWWLINTEINSSKKGNFETYITDKRLQIRNFYTMQSDKYLFFL